MKILIFFCNENKDEMKKAHRDSNLIIFNWRNMIAC